MRTFIMQPVRIFGGIARDHFMGPLKFLAENLQIADKIMRKTESALKETPHPDELKLFSRKTLFSKEKAMSVLNFNPEYDVNNGLDVTKAWLDHIGFLPAPKL